MVENAAVKTNHSHKKLNGKPDGDCQDLSAVKNLFSKFKTNDSL
jgi:hypothetical protein